MPIHRLVYYSTNRVHSLPAQIAAEVQHILDASRRNNQLVGITGALMFSAGFFGQVLEGPQGAIEATFERIQQDARHGDVSLLEFVSTDDRAFDNWAMAYVGEPSEAFATFELATGFDDKKILGDRLFSKLREMVASSPIAA